MINDPISDMLTRMRNALLVNKTTVVVLNTKINRAITQILKKQGFIKDLNPKGYQLNIELKYIGKQPGMVHLQRLSSPSLRRYAKWKHIPRLLNGMGLVILSTPHGIMTDREARNKKLGGELICCIW